MLAWLIAQPGVSPGDGQHQWFRERLASALYRRFAVTRSAVDLQTALTRHRPRFVALHTGGIFWPASPEHYRREAALRFARFGFSADISDLVVAIMLLRFARGQMTDRPHNVIDTALRSLAWAESRVVERLCAEVAKLPEPSPALDANDTSA